MTETELVEMLQDAIDAERAAIDLLGESTTMRLRKRFVRGPDARPSPSAASLRRRAATPGTGRYVSEAHRRVLSTFADVAHSLEQGQTDDEAVLNAVRVFYAIADLVAARRSLGIRPDPNVLSTLLRVRSRDFLGVVEIASLTRCSPCADIVGALAEFRGHAGVEGRRGVFGTLADDIPEGVVAALDAVSAVLRRARGINNGDVEIPEGAVAVLRRCGDGADAGQYPYTNEPRRWDALAALVDPSVPLCPHDDGVCARPGAGHYIDHLYAQTSRWIASVRLFAVVAGRG